MLALKRYSDAVRDGDKIYATILGIGTSNDGKGKYFLSPNSKGQILAYERTYAAAGIDPKTIEYVECHATGTDLGDKTELNSMETFFGPYGAKPRLGSVKSNLGHLLTAAGMPSMMKTILSMSEGLIPPTIRVEQPLSSANNVFAAEQVVTQPTPWPSNAPVKRAAVSAFGFGGTNAHLVLEHGSETQSPPPPEPATPLPNLAIVGMDAFFGGCDGLDAFDRTLYDGKQHFIPVPPQRWKGLEGEEEILKKYGFADGKAPKGAYIQEFDMDFLRFKIPPNANEQPIPQQLLLLQVADRALKDAGIQEGANVASIVAMETELAGHQYRGRCDISWQLPEGLAQSNLSLASDKLSELKGILKESLHLPAQVSRYISYIGNIMACRIAAAWDFSGPAFTLSAQENSAFKALEVAQLLLANGEVDAVVVGAVDLAGGAENVLFRNLLAKVNSGAATLGCDTQVDGWLVGEGAGAIVLKRLDTAKQSQDRIYATIDAISLVQETGSGKGIPQPPVAATVARACQQAFGAAGINPADIGYLELFGSGVPEEDEAEMQGILQAYRTGQPELSCAIGSVKANIGHTRAASGMASLIKTALCLYHQYIPATPQWTGPKHPELWQGSPFYVAPDSRQWATDADTPKRIAAINGLGLDGTHAHVILSEDLTPTTRSSRYLEQTPFYLFPLAAESREALFEQLQALEQTLESSPSLSKTAAQTFQAYQNHPHPNYVLAIVGGSKDELLREIQRAGKGVKRAFEQGKDWQTPAGSYLTTKPLGKQGGVAFVYPGAFTSYLGMGKDVFRLFPRSNQGIAEFSRSSQHFQKLLHDYNRLLYPRSLTKLSKRQWEALDEQFTENAVMMLMSGTISAVLSTAIFRDYFGVQPSAAFGYSLGETSMMFALGVWTEAQGIVGTMDSSELFKTRLSGPKNAVREYWGLPVSEGEADEDFWCTYVLLAEASVVQTSIESEERVYLTQINTPQEVVIAGEKQACQRIIDRLQCDAFRIPVSDVMHCAPTRSEFGQLAEWFTLPVAARPPVKLYSAANNQPMQLDSRGIANSIATALCQPCDFPQLIHQVYNEGARIFIELGPGSSCSRWIRDVLKQQAHLAMPIDTRGADNHASIVRGMAKLVSHQVSVDISCLYAPLEESLPRKKSLVRTVTLGGRRIRDTILTEENRASFTGSVSVVEEKATVQPPQPEVAATASSAMPSPVRELAGVASGGNRTSSVQSPPPRQTGVPSTPSNLDMTDPPPAQASPNLESYNLHYQKLKENTTRSTQAHATFLNARTESLRQISELVQLQIAVSERLLADGPGSQMPESPPQTPSGFTPRTDVVFDEAAVLEAAGGKLSRVFGKEYEAVDAYPRCARVPMPPYLFISRITKLDAKRGCFEPCSIETEFDIPADAWYALDGQIPGAIFIEASHGNIFLASYLGIDFNYKGQRVYRAIGGSTTFLGELPRAGETFRCKISINSFSKAGNTLLFFFTHECYSGDRLFLKMESGAGFFSDEDLKGGRGVTLTAREKQEREKIQKQHFTPLLKCEKTAFSDEDIRQLSLGNLVACFGKNYDTKGKNPSLRVPPLPICMFDRILSVDPTGGAWGLGLIVAEKTLEPDHWYFNCHFKNDYCLPGTLISEGAAQVLAFYLLYLGLQLHTENAEFRPIPHLPQGGRYRGQIRPISSKLTFKVEVTEIGLNPTPYAKADAFVIFEGRTISIIKDTGIEMGEKSS